MNQLAPNDPRKSPRSLAEFLFASHMALATAILAAFALFSFGLNYRFTYDKVESELLGAAEFLNEQLLTGTGPESLSLPDAFSHRFGKAKRDHAYWVLWSSEGEQVASSGDLPADLQRNESLPPHDGKRPYNTRKYGRNFDLSIQAVSGGELLVGRPLAKEFDGFWRMAQWLVFSFVVGLTLAAIFAWILVQKTTRPIVSLAHTVANIDQNDLGRRLSSDQPTLEMSNFAKVFNSMLQDLQDAFERQRRFTSDAAHELRTPVAIITSQCDLTLSRSRDEASYRSALATCARSASHMTLLINELLLLSRISDGKQNLSPRLVRFDGLVREVVELAIPLATAKGLRFKLELSETEVETDESLVKQVLLNLVSNAIQFSHPDGEIRIALVETGSHALLKVSDDGIGIDAQDLPKIRDRFFQVNPARTMTLTGGSGLGLSITDAILKTLSGDMTIQSKLGVGTQVEVRIPKSREGS